jgi:hypothetical protein
VTERSQRTATARTLIEPKRAIPVAPTPAEQPRPKLVIVPTLRARRRRASAVGLLACACVFGFLVGLTAFQAQLAQNQMEVDQVDKDLRAEQLKFDRSRLEVARLQAPRNVLARADKLGMTVSTRFVFAAPSQAVVTEVLVAASGGPEAALTSESLTRPDWSAYKKIMGEAP